MAATLARSRVPTGEPSPFNVPTEKDQEQEPDVADMEYRDQDDQASDVGSDVTDASDDSDREVPQSVLDDMVKFEESFKGITKQYRLIDRIGEGTFSTVYKAEDLLYDEHRNDWDLDATESTSWVSPPVKGGRMEPQRPKRRYVAIKKIYVTSSPLRIQNELELLHDLRACKAICPLITAFRYQDQVVAILPYYRHQDFREFYREMFISDVQFYFRSLFLALAAVHRQGILHRDIKPTNFLYDVEKKRGVLVDFGLAEREGTDTSFCICQDSASRRRTKIENCYASVNPPLAGYPKNDTRPSRRANRAGTRGFRAPEVLLKCTSQSTKIDIWSAGVILLTILARRFPFFNSTDDIDAMIEVSSVFGKRRMAQTALLHGAVYECNIPTVGEKGFPFEKLIVWSNVIENLTSGQKMAIKFLEQCMELDPSKRISAKEALKHEFLREDTLFNDQGDEIEMIGS